jgi:hypothetical protein
MEIAGIPTSVIQDDTFEQRIILWDLVLYKKVMEKVVLSLGTSV